MTKVTLKKTNKVLRAALTRMHVEDDEDEDESPIFYFLEVCARAVSPLSLSSLSSWWQVAQAFLQSFSFHSSSLFFFFRFLLFHLKRQILTSETRNLHNVFIGVVSNIYSGRFCFWKKEKLNCNGQPKMES